MRPAAEGHRARGGPPGRGGLALDGVVRVQAGDRGRVEPRVRGNASVKVRIFFTNRIMFLK